MTINERIKQGRNLTINERIRYLRKEILKLNQTDFAKAIGMKQTGLSYIEKDNATVKEQVTKTICMVFNINQNWLINGIGPMEISLSEDEEIKKYIEMLLKDKEDFVAQKITRFIIGYEKLDPADKKVIENFVRQLFENEQNTMDTPAASVSVEEEEAEYIKSYSNSAEKTGLSALSTTDGTEKASNQ